MESKEKMTQMQLDNLWEAIRNLHVGTLMGMEYVIRESICKIIVDGALENRASLMETFKKPEGAKNIFDKHMIIHGVEAEELAGEENEKTEEA